MGSRRPWTTGELRRAVERLRAGEDVGDVAVELGRSRSALVQQLRRCGYSPDELVREGRWASRAELQRRYERGDLTAVQAAQAAGMTTRGWLAHLHRVRGEPRPQRRRRTYTDQAVLRRAAAMRLDGARYPEIAEATGIPPGSLWSLLRRYARDAGIENPALPHHRGERRD